MKRKKRDYQSSELVKQFARIYGLEEKLEGLKIRDLLEDYLDADLFADIKAVVLEDRILTLSIHSPMLKNDFRLRKSFYLKKFQDEIGEEKIQELRIE